MKRNKVVINEDTQEINLDLFLNYLILYAI